MNSIGNKIKSLRIQKNWSQEEIAFRLEISLPAYSKIERDITDINFSRLTQIAKLFEIPLPELVDLENTVDRRANFENLLKEKNELIIELQNKLINCLEN